jgi:[ribosomal protein S18]-alanine N-acetyltransferase
MEETPITMISLSQAGLSIAPMTPDLLPSVVALEGSCGLNSRGLDGYRKMLSNQNSILLVALPPLNPISPIGLLSSEVVIDELQIDNLAVSERWRRKGIGRTLLNFALTAAARLGALVATLEVRSANSPARAFYEKEGFTVAGLRKRYYMDPPDDALLLSRKI